MAQHHQLKHNRLTLPCDSDLSYLSRTAIQNRKMWPQLKDLSDQVLWFGNKYDSDDWKDLITALVAKTKKQEQRMAPGLDGGVVMFGQRTCKMTIPQMVDIIETIYWFGTQQGVNFSEQSRNEIEWVKCWGKAMRNNPNQRTYRSKNDSPLSGRSSSTC